MMLGVLIMALGIGMVGFVDHIYSIFALLTCFYVSIIVSEPARNLLVANLSRPQARGSYIGFSRLGLAIGGMLGYIGGGPLLDVPPP